MDAHHSHNRDRDRDRERPYIRNPNFLPSRQSSTYAHPGPPSIQQPQPPPPMAQQPRFDPFQKQEHDPFRPVTQPDRRNAPAAKASTWGADSGPGPSDLQQRDILQPAPPPPPSPFHSRPPAFYQEDNSRRRSLGSGYNGTFESGPPGPPGPPGHSTSSFMTRTMPPPPSSPHRTPSLSSDSHLPRNYPPNPSIHPSSRDRAPSPPVHRPNNMSISSIMGDDSPSGPKRTNSGVSGAEKSPMSMNYGPPGISQASLRPTMDGPSTRPRTPEEQESYANRPLRSPRDLPRPSLEQRTESKGYYEVSRNSSRSLLPPFQSTSQPSSTVIPPRPYSQPAGLDSPENAAHNSHPRDPYPQQRNFEHDRTLSRRTVSDEHRQIHALNQRVPREQNMADARGARRSPYRIAEPHPVPDPSYRPTSDANPLKDNHNNMRPFDRPTSPFRRIDYQNIHADRPIASREGADLPSSKSFQSEMVTPQFGPFLPDDSARFNTHSTAQNQHAPPPSTISGDQRNGVQGNGTSSFQSASRARGTANEKLRKPLLDSGLQKSLEESQMSHRSLLGASQDNHRRVDRASPLPQAVQGASAQPAGSGRDPSIKSEFGRMFSGIGSGVGSTPQPMPPSHGNGSPTPARQASRLDDGDVEMIDRPDSFESNGLDRVPAARKGKRLIDHEGRASHENGEGRSTPMQGLNSRGGKRSKQTNPSHHHHHPPHGHHHHHRPPRADDELNATFANRRSGTTPFNTLKFDQAGQGPQNLPGFPRHHHHPPHHHHHVPGTSAPPPAPAPAIKRDPRVMTTVKTSPLLRSVADKPRRHLGSQLYTTTVSLPPTLTTPLYAKYPFEISHNLIPRFDDRENCTFTIRVPRFYLSETCREQVCGARKIWGTDVYTDDSDPLAAAIHSGWIWGAWGEDVDIELLELNGPTKLVKVNGKVKVDSESREGEEMDVLSAPPPSGPAIPPADCDAHITLLVLPALEGYEASNWNGMRSRSWGSNHDGMSFKVEKIEWVDEGPQNRWKENGMVARKERIRANLKATKRCKASASKAVKRATVASGAVAKAGA